MFEPDVIMESIGTGIGLAQRGDRAAARAVFADVWARIGPEGDAFHRCALAHSMADVQDDAADELAWDLRALEAAGSITDERAHEVGIAGPVEAFYASLHLNLGEDYRKLGDGEKAREHLELARSSLGSLERDEYTAWMAEKLEAFADRLLAGAHVGGGDEDSGGGAERAEG